MNFGRLMFKIQSINGRSVIYPCGMLRVGLEGDGRGGEVQIGKPPNHQYRKKDRLCFVPLPKFFFQGQIGTKGMKEKIAVAG